METEGVNNPSSPEVTSDTRAEYSASVVGTKADSSAQGAGREDKPRKDLRGPVRSKALFLLIVQERHVRLLRAE